LRRIAVDAAAMADFDRARNKFVGKWKTDAGSGASHYCKRSGHVNHPIRDWLPAEPDEWVDHIQ